MARKLQSDKFLFCVIVILTLAGVDMVYSASAEMATAHYGTEFYFASRQLVSAAVGLLAMVLLMMKSDYRKLNRPLVIFPALAVELLLLAAALFSSSRNNAHRWLHWGAASFQPSELAKLVLVIFLAYFLDLRRREVNDFAHTLVPIFVVVVFVVGLILKEPDLGTSLAILFVVASMLWVAGLQARYFAIPVLAAAPMFYFFVYRVPYRWGRIVAFLDPTGDPLGKGFQALQAKIAVASGGITGVGLMESKQKLFFLPEPHNDCIFAVIGEEFGFLGAVIALSLFVFILWRGLRAAMRCQDNFGKLLAVGITAMLVGQALVNISVVLSLFPTKGIPLPFVSYGGSALIIDLAAAGMLLNISQYSG